jgi:MoxR-like ATPase
MLSEHAARDRVLDVEAVTATAEVIAAQEATARVYASDPLCRYVVALVDHTRADPRTELGASPRAGLWLLRAAMAHAALQGRDHALPDDVQSLATSVLAHRLLLAPGSEEHERERIVADALSAVPAL